VAATVSREVSDIVANLLKVVFRGHSTPLKYLTRGYPGMQAQISEKYKVVHFCK
jgi:hypothetical protein